MIFDHYDIILFADPLHGGKPRLGDPHRNPLGLFIGEAAPEVLQCHCTSCHNRYCRNGSLVSPDRLTADNVPGPQ
jgi:hypothetical protein